MAECSPYKGEIDKQGKEGQSEKEMTQSEGNGGCSLEKILVVGEKKDNGLLRQAARQREEEET